MGMYRNLVAAEPTPDPAGLTFFYPFPPCARAALPPIPYQHAQTPPRTLLLLSSRPRPRCGFSLLFASSPPKSTRDRKMHSRTTRSYNDLDYVPSTGRLGPRARPQNGT